MDLKVALRGITGTPGFAALVIATMALGIGANTAMHGVMRAVFFRPLPFPEPDRIVTVWQSDPERGITRQRVSGPNFVDWEAQSDVFEAMGALPGWTGTPSTFNVVGRDVTERVSGLYASSGFFRVLGVPPMLGRTLTSEDDMEELLPRIAATPGVRSVGAATATPLEVGPAGQAITRENRPALLAVDSPQVVQTAATPGYFTTLGVRLTKGRFFTEADRADGALVALLNGVLSYTVGRRTREIGIRMALGADRTQVSRMIVSQAVRLTAAGILLGLAGAVAAARVIATLLFGVQPLDPVTFAGTCLLMLAASLLASSAPVRRATRVDPAVALRSE